MLIRKGMQYELYPWKVKYNQYGKEIEQWALPNKEWWIDFAERWEHTKIIEFSEVSLTEEQFKRFGDVKNMPEDFISQYIDYVIDGTFSEGVPKTHPFFMVFMQDENEKLKSQLKATQNAVDFLILNNGGML